MMKVIPDIFQDTPVKSSSNATFPPRSSTPGVKVTRPSSKKHTRTRDLSDIPSTPSDEKRERLVVSHEELPTQLDNSRRRCRGADVEESPQLMVLSSLNAGSL